MDTITKNITEILMAIVGVAVLSVIVMEKNNTTGVISAASGGFGKILSVAMGGSLN
jgi:hypothetical protein